MKFVFPENSKKNFLKIYESISLFLWNITNFILSKYILGYMDIECILSVYYKNNVFLIKISHFQFSCTFCIYIYIILKIW